MQGWATSQIEDYCARKGWKVEREKEEMIQGVVQKIFDKDFGKGPVYSFTLKGDRTFYRLGPKKPSFAEGDSVQFETKTSGNSTYANNVAPWKGGTVPTSVANAARQSSGGGPATADQFWRNKEARDVLTQQRIELQSCRNSAIELVRVLLSPGVEAVKLPAKQADKERVVAEMVTHYTKSFLGENKSGLSDNRDEKIDKDAAVEAAPEAKEQEEEWN
jgi:hypothetical protein